MTSTYQWLNEKQKQTKTTKQKMRHIGSSRGINVDVARRGYTIIHVQSRFNQKYNYLICRSTLYKNLPICFEWLLNTSQSLVCLTVASDNL